MFWQSCMLPVHTNESLKSMTIICFSGYLSYNVKLKVFKPCTGHTCWCTHGTGVCHLFLTVTQPGISVPDSVTKLKGHRFVLQSRCVWAYMVMLYNYVIKFAVSCGLLRADCRSVTCVTTQRLPQKWLPERRRCDSSWPELITHLLPITGRGQISIIMYVFSCS